MAQIVTITNPLTGQPAQVDQLEHTAQQIDDGIGRALPGGAIDLALSTKPNPNLLDNWYFGNPVDQRGGYVVPPGVDIWKSSDSSIRRVTDTYIQVEFFYPDGNAGFVIDGEKWCAINQAGNSQIVRGYTGDGYGPDRWRLNNITCLITPDGLTLVSNGENSLFECYLDTNLTGITIAMSALIGGVVYGGSKTVDQYDFTDTVAFPGGTIRVFYSGGKTIFRLWLSEVVGTTVQPKAAKLELGSQQTLAHQENGVWVLNEIPNYGEQLARCQRYFQTFATESLRPTNALDFRPVMRANPALSTITVGGKTLYTASADL